MSEEKVFVDPRKQALLGLGIMDETPLETIERVFISKNNEYGDSWCSVVSLRLWQAWRAKLTG